MVDDFCIKDVTITAVPRGFTKKNIFLQCLGNLNYIIQSSTKKHILLIFDG